MRTTRRVSRLLGCPLFLVAIGVHAATIMVRDVDVRNMTAGSQVDIPVQISGVTISSFGAFSLDFAYDTVSLRWDSLSRGPLLSATGVNASPEYAPYLWALEASHDGDLGTLRVTGMILGANPDDNTLAGMVEARLSNPEGVLFTLHFTLLATDTAPISLAGGTVGGRCAIVSDDETGDGTEEPTGTDLVDGGTLVDGTPNWWALENLGDPEADPNADSDGDWRSNTLEYEDDTDPTVADQRLSFQAGWNMLGFRTVPDMTPAEWIDQTNAAYAARRGDRAEGDLLSGTIFYFDPAKLRYVVPTAFEAGKAYWFFAYGAGDAQFVGTPAPTDYSIGSARGWHMVALPENRAVHDIASDARSCQGWDAASQTYEADVETMQGAAGYWLYRSGAE